jgi:hypothetical protein
LAVPNLPRRPIVLCLLLAAALPLGAAPPGPAQQTPEWQRRQKVLQLTRKSVELFKQKKYDQVEAALTEALALDPNHATNIYNMACVKALKGDPATAMAYLERAADAGFTDFLHIQSDEDLQTLRNLDRYKALIAQKDLYQKKDAQRALDALKTEFGDKYLYDLDADSKLIFAADTDKETLAAVKRLLTAQARSLWEQLFSHKPDQYVAIVLPSAEHYRKLIRRPGVEGIYIPPARMLIARRLGQVMTHEFTHALHAGDLDAVGQEHPIWIVEGLASLFESARFDDAGKLVASDNYRLWYLRAAYRQGTLPPLDQVIAWDQERFVKNANIAYGTASSVLMYLYDQGLLKKFYDTYKANYEKEATGRLALEMVTGKSVEDFDKDWRDWMMKRNPPAMNTGPDGAYLGVRLSQANDGLRIDIVEPNSPAANAGIKVADIIVGLNNLETRDQVSLMPLLKEMKPGDKITLKIKRAEQYLDVPFTLGQRGAPPKPTTRPRAGTQPGK